MTNVNIYRYRCPRCGKVILFENAQYTDETGEYTCQKCGEVYQEHELEALDGDLFGEVAVALGSEQDSSAWRRGVKAYAFDLLHDLQDIATWGGRIPEPGNECRNLLLNGARDWREYSWGGCSLVYNGDIAERLCAPSELKKTRNGERRPNSREEWLDVQARALYQACNRLCRLYRAAWNGEI